MVPTFDKFLYPVLNVLNDGKEHTLKSLMDDMAHVFSLSDIEVAEKVSGGSETKLHNRIS